MLPEEYPGLFYHKVDPQAMARMDQIRAAYLALGELILTLCPVNRYRSLAMTDLESTLMRAIQSLAVQGELIDPRPLPSGRES